MLAEADRRGSRAAQRARPATSRVPYDYLVLAPGAVDNYFGHDDWRALAPGHEGRRGGDASSARACCARSSAPRPRPTSAGRAAHLTFVIVGGGPDGRRTRRRHQGAGGGRHSARFPQRRHAPRARHPASRPGSGCCRRCTRTPRRGHCAAADARRRGAAGRRVTRVVRTGSRSAASFITARMSSGRQACARRRWQASLGVALGAPGGRVAVAAGLLHCPGIPRCS